MCTTIHRTSKKEISKTITTRAVPNFAAIDPILEDVDRMDMGTDTSTDMGMDTNMSLMNMGRGMVEEATAPYQTANYLMVFFKIREYQVKLKTTSPK